MAELHETSMGRKLIEHTLPEIARQLEKIADALEKANQLKEAETKEQTIKDQNQSNIK
jgi:hypothetical protein